jgi:hypothetical protein
MPTITCNPPPSPLPIELEVASFPPVKWTTVIKWFGHTAQPLRFLIRVAEPGVLVEWRRFGLSLIPIATGGFVSEEYFTLYPSDLWLKIQLRAPVECTITVLPL